MQDLNVVFPQDMGKGHKRNEQTKKWDVDLTDLVDGTTIAVGPDGKIAGKAGSLDCAEIGKLPLAQWKQGTSILASQDGECKRLVPVQNLFQEVGVAIAANKLSGLVGDSYNVVVTVTNSGEATNDLTDLVITKPQLGNYTLKDFRATASEGADIETVSDLVYKVKGLKSGGTAKVSFTVIANAAGTLQFGATVNPNTVLDLQSNNNQATVTLSVQTPVDTNYVATVECPAMDFVDVETGKPIFMSNPNQAGISTVLSSDLKKSGRTNFYANKSSISLKSSQPIGTVVCYDKEAHRGHTFECVTDDQGNSYVVDGEFSLGGVYKNTTTPWSSVTGVTVDTSTNTITLSNRTDQLIILGVKPKGGNCDFQYIRIANASPLKKKLTRSLTLNSGPADNVEIYALEPTKQPVPSDLNVVSPVKIVGAFDNGYSTTVDTYTNRVKFKGSGVYTLNVAVGTVPSKEWSTGLFKVVSEGTLVTVTISETATSSDNTTVNVDGINFELAV